MMPKENASLFFIFLNFLRIFFSTIFWLKFCGVSGR